MPRPMVATLALNENMDSVQVDATTFELFELLISIFQ